MTLAVCAARFTPPLTRSLRGTGIVDKTGGYVGLAIDAGPRCPKPTSDAQRSAIAPCPAAGVVQAAATRPAPSLECLSRVTRCVARFRFCRSRPINRHTALLPHCGGVAEVAASNVTTAEPYIVAGNGTRMFSQLARFAGASLVFKNQALPAPTHPPFRRFLLQQIDQR